MSPHNAAENDARVSPRTLDRWASVSRPLRRATLSASCSRINNTEPSGYLQHEPRSLAWSHRRPCYHGWSCCFSVTGVKETRSASRWSHTVSPRTSSTPVTSPAWVWVIMQPQCVLGRPACACLARGIQIEIRISSQRGLCTSFQR